MNTAKPVEVERLSKQRRLKEYRYKPELKREGAEIPQKWDNEHKNSALKTLIKGLFYYSGKNFVRLDLQQGGHLKVFNTFRNIFYAVLSLFFLLFALFYLFFEPKHLHTKEYRDWNILLSERIPSKISGHIEALGEFSIKRYGEIKKILVSKELYRYDINHINDITSAIVSESIEQGIDPFFIFCVIKAESDFQSNVVSEKGAVGLMQILPITAVYVNNILLSRSNLELLQLNRKKNVQNSLVNSKSRLLRNYTVQSARRALFNELFNIRTGILYILYLHNIFEGDWFSVLAGYNWGPENVKASIYYEEEPFTKRIFKNPFQRRVVIPDAVEAYAESILSNYRKLTLKYD
jgi:hypothetical protein